MRAELTLPNSQRLRKVIPHLAGVMDRWRVTNPDPGVTITPYKAVTGWDEWWTYACPGCGVWQIDYGPDNENADDTQLLQETINQHRAECPALDMLAGLAGVPT